MGLIYSSVVQNAIVLLLLPPEQNVFDCWASPETPHSTHYLGRYDRSRCICGWIFGWVQDAHHGVCLLASDESLNH